MLPQKILKKLHTTMAILVLFEQFLKKVCQFLAPNFECFTKYDAFCSHSFDYVTCVLKATKAYCYEEVRNYEKILFIQNIVENGWWWGNAYAAYSTSPLDSPLIV